MSGDGNTTKRKWQEEEIKRLCYIAFTFHDKLASSEEFHGWCRDVLKIVIETCGRDSHEMMIIQAILEKLRRFGQFVNRARDQVEKELEYEAPIVRNSDKYSEKLFSEIAELLQSIITRA